MLVTSVAFVAGDQGICGGGCGSCNQLTSGSKFWKTLAVCRAVATLAASLARAAMRDDASWLMVYAYYQGRTLRYLLLVFGLILFTSLGLELSTGVQPNRSFLSVTTLLPVTTPSKDR